MDAATLFILFCAFVALLVFISLTATALFRPDHLATLVEAYKVIALALVGKKYSERLKSDRTDESDPNKLP